MIRIIISFMICFMPGFILADTKIFTITGKVLNITGAPVHILLVDEETSKVPFAGIKKIIITPDDKAVKNGCIGFIFKNIPEGQYGIRCFQDDNGNGKLDKGMFGPNEPWGLSWNNNKTSGWPSFKNFCFSLNGDINDLTITLN